MCLGLVVCSGVLAMGKVRVLSHVCVVWLALVMSSGVPGIGRVLSAWYW